MLPRIHLAFRQFIRPVAPSLEGSSLRAGTKPLVQEKDESKDESNPQDHPQGQAQDREAGPNPVAPPVGEKTSVKSDSEAAPPERKLEIWNPQKLISLLKAIVTNEELHLHQKGNITYGELRNNRQSGVQFRKGAVIDRKAG